MFDNRICAQITSRSPQTRVLELLCRPVPARAPANHRRSRAGARTFIPIVGREALSWHISSDVLNRGRAITLDIDGWSMVRGRGRGPAKASCCPNFTLPAFNCLLA